MTDRSVHEFRPDYYHCTLGPHEPALSVAPGDTVVTWCVDSSGINAEGHPLDLDQLAGPPGARTVIANPLTGPIFVETAEPGDALLVRLDEIVPTRDWASSLNASAFGLFSSEDLIGPTTFAPAQWAPEEQCRFRWELDHTRGVGRLPLARSRLRHVEIPLRPFLGNVGVAPERGESRMTMTAGRHGGNMDCPELRTGATLYLPVFVPGGLLCLGDCHAAQGDGEICGVALETSCRVQFRVEVIKRWSLRWPRLEDARHLMAIGNARPLDAAFRIAHTELINWLAADFGFDRFEAFQVLSQVGSARIGNVVDPAYSVVAKFPKQYLPV